MAQTSFSLNLRSAAEIKFKFPRWAKRAYEDSGAILLITIRCKFSGIMSIMY
ncbi:unannotated protein [freshwater metagenome]|uniref:Unannotated protein n=1 Tax=freshwater metagenome TaxID=449393 RepID=A0A6J7PI37_9ZZZZ